jgi:S-adenosylmethionine:tRNA ribosyltransferase-isomerase
MDRLSDYDYHLPEELIAQVPLDDRASARLLHLDRRTGEVAHRQFRDILNILQSGDTLVVNNTRVSAVRLFGQRPSGGQVEALLLQAIAPGEYEALVRPGKRLKPGSEIQFGPLSGTITGDLSDGRKSIRIDGKPEDVGEVPLPPYIHEKLDNPERYQTVYADPTGSAAAPTAGLHFTPEILGELEAKGVRIAKVTLHVSIDTFRPIQTDVLDEHVMHGEWCEILPDAAEVINSAPRRIIAVGTTSVRTLEAMAVASRRVRSGTKVTKIFIRPGYEFQVVDGMFTNFHLPKTSMLAMISAMASIESIFRAYEEAVKQRYRFLSFGDSMLIL